MEKEDMNIAVNQLLGEYLLLQAQFNSLKTMMLATTLISIRDYPAEMQTKIKLDFQKQYAHLVQSNHDTLLVTHPYLSAYWKNKLKGEIGDSGVLFPDSEMSGS